MVFPLPVFGGPPLGRNSFPKQGRKADKTMPLNKNGHFTTVDGVPVRKLFVSNLSPSTVERDLMLVFKDYGRIVDVSVIKNVNDKAPNFGFVTYETPAEASRALKKKHIIFVLNRKVFVSPADSWHQPLELPNGEILWDRRKGKGDFNNKVPNEGCSKDLDVFEAVVDENDVTSPISKLNDDCLLLIFDYLSMNERLVLNKVCRRWNVLNKRLWHGLKKLDFSVPPLSLIPLTDSILDEYLKLCPNISSINIAQDNHKLSGSAIVTIGNCCKKLESIAVRDIKMQKRSLAFLARSCPLLKSFCMDACSVHHDNEMVGLVKNCSSLESISLRYSNTSIGVWLKFLHPPMKSISLEMYDFNPDYLLQGITNTKGTLKELKFVSCESIRSKDVEIIASIVPELNSLTLAGGFTDFKSHSLNPITKLKNLTRLDLDNNAFVCDHFLSELSQHCGHLKYFSLSGIEDRYLTEQGLGVLSKFTGLTHLTLACVSKLNDAILKSISQKIKNLQHLDLMGCSSITDEGCQCIVKNCKKLEVLDVSGCMNVTNLTVTMAIKQGSLKPPGDKKLKIIAGESGIDLDICWSSEVIVDPSSSIMSHYPSAMFIIDPDFRYDDDELFHDLYYLDEFYPDISDGEEDDFDDEAYEYFDYFCNDSDGSSFIECD